MSSIPVDYISSPPNFTTIFEEIKQDETLSDAQKNIILDHKALNDIVEGIDSPENAEVALRLFRLEISVYADVLPRLQANPEHWAQINFDLNLPDEELAKRPASVLYFRAMELGKVNDAQGVIRLTGLAQLQQNIWGVRSCYNYLQLKGLSTVGQSQPDQMAQTYQTIIYNNLEAILARINQMVLYSPGAAHALFQRLTSLIGHAHLVTLNYSFSVLANCFIQSLADVPEEKRVQVALKFQNLTKASSKVENNPLLPINALVLFPMFHDLVTLLTEELNATSQYRERLVDIKRHMDMFAQTYPKILTAVNDENSNFYEQPAADILVYVAQMCFSKNVGIYNDVMAFSLLERAAQSQQIQAVYTFVEKVREAKKMVPDPSIRHRARELSTAILARPIEENLKHYLQERALRESYDLVKELEADPIKLKTYINDFVHIVASLINCKYELTLDPQTAKSTKPPHYYTEVLVHGNKYLNDYKTYPAIHLFTSLNLFHNIFASQQQILTGQAENEETRSIRLVDTALSLKFEMLLPPSLTSTSRKKHIIEMAQQMADHSEQMRLPNFAVHTLNTITTPGYEEFLLDLPSYQEESPEHKEALSEVLFFTLIQDNKYYDPVQVSFDDMPTQLTDKVLYAISVYSKIPYFSLDTNHLKGLDQDYLEKISLYLFAAACSTNDENVRNRIFADMGLSDDNVESYLENLLNIQLNTPKNIIETANELKKLNPQLDVTPYNKALTVLNSLNRRINPQKARDYLLAKFEEKMHKDLLEIRKKEQQ